MGAMFLDQVKIREEQLDDLYRYDGELVGAVRELEGKVKSAGKSSDPSSSVRDLEAAIDALIVKVEARKGLFNPSTSSGPGL